MKAREELEALYHATQELIGQIEKFSGNINSDKTSKNSVESWLKVNNEQSKTAKQLVDWANSLKIPMEYDYLETRLNKNKNDADNVKKNAGELGDKLAKHPGMAKLLFGNGDPWINTRGQAKNTSDGLLATVEFLETALQKKLTTRVDYDDLMAEKIEEKINSSFTTLKKQILSSLDELEKRGGSKERIKAIEKARNEIKNVNLGNLEGKNAKERMEVINKTVLKLDKGLDSLTKIASVRSDLFSEKAANLAMGVRKQIAVSEFSGNASPETKAILNDKAKNTAALGQKKDDKAPSVPENINPRRTL